MTCLPTGVRSEALFLIAKIRSSSVVGVEAVPIWVEVDIARGLPHFSIVGLPDSGVRESKERVRSALRNAGFTFPVARITVNLAPGNIRKAGSAYDLPIALGVLVAQGVIPQHALERWLILGELALDGAVRRVRGALCTAVDLVAAPSNTFSLMLPSENAHEVRLLPELHSVPVSSLRQAVRILAGSERPVPIHPESTSDADKNNSPDQALDPVVGQEAAKRAIEVALAGGHHALLIGPPGSGKSLLGERVRHLLPALTPQEAIEVNRVYSAAGLLDEAGALQRIPPIRAPHHTVSTRAMIGGGSPVMPGELSLAHRGILLLDEMALFKRTTLDALREPLEQGFIRMNSDSASTTLPCRVCLLGTTNPCPCGWLGDPQNRCMCSPAEIARYRKKISGPLLDRIDLVIEVARTPLDDPVVTGEQVVIQPEPLGGARQRIQSTRELQRDRNANGELNGTQSVPLVEAMSELSGSTRQLVTRIADKFALTGRGLYRLLRVARTIADLDRSSKVESEHVAEAAAYRLPPDYVVRDGA